MDIIINKAKNVRNRETEKIKFRIVKLRDMLKVEFMLKDELNFLNLFVWFFPLTQIVRISHFRLLLLSWPFIEYNSISFRLSFLWIFAFSGFTFLRSLQNENSKREEEEEEDIGVGLGMNENGIMAAK